MHQTRHPYRTDDCPWLGKVPPVQVRKSQLVPSSGFNNISHQTRLGTEQSVTLGSISWIFLTYASLRQWKSLNIGSFAAFPPKFPLGLTQYVSSLLTQYFCMFLRHLSKVDVFTPQMNVSNFTIDHFLNPLEGCFRQYEPKPSFHQTHGRFFDPRSICDLQLNRPFVPEVELHELVINVDYLLFLESYRTG
jgi:hypothetical protein